MSKTGIYRTICFSSERFSLSSSFLSRSFFSMPLSGASARTTRSRRIFCKVFVNSQLQHNLQINYSVFIESYKIWNISDYVMKKRSDTKHPKYCPNQYTGFEKQFNHNSNSTTIKKKKSKKLYAMIFDSYCFLTMKNLRPLFILGVQVSELHVDQAS